MLELLEKYEGLVENDLHYDLYHYNQSVKYLESVVEINAKLHSGYSKLAELKTIQGKYILSLSNGKEKIQMKLN